jgi:hypothetical protein
MVKSKRTIVGAILLGVLAVNPVYAGTLKERASPNIQALRDQFDILLRQTGRSDAQNANLISLAEAIEEAEDDADTPKVEGDLSGLGFGVALGSSFRGSTDIISTTLENNVIRVTDGDKTSLGFWLETHYFFGLDDGVTAKDGSKIHKYGLGPFVAAQASSDNKVIKSLGLGVMLGLRRTENSTNSFNIGVGYAATQINVLTDGLTVNEVLPSGVTTVNTKTKIVGAPFVITSFAF